MQTAYKPDHSGTNLTESGLFRASFLPRKPGARVIVLFVFLVISTYDLYAQRSPLNQPVTISFFNVPLRVALTKLSMQYAIPISFDPDQRKMDRIINNNFYNATVSDVLRTILDETGLGWKYFAEAIIIIPSKKNSTISGRVTDASTGEDLIGAVIYVSQLKQGSSSNNYGFYSLTLPEDTYELLVSYLGYQVKKISVTYSGKNQTLDIQLEKLVNELKEVVITSKSGGDSLQPLGVSQQLQWDQLRQMPFFKGEADVIKALQMQNGVVGMIEGSSSMFIRGGNRDQNLIILDEAVVYNPAHLFGLTSVFNPDALKNIQLYKEDMPSNFGGRLSSVIDARMADGNDKKIRVKGGMSLLSARLSLEGPIIKDKGSFLVAGRKSLANLLNNDFDLYNLQASYYDLNFKINYKLNPTNRLFLSAYLGRDKVNAINGYLNRWGNQTSTLRWNHVFNPKLFLNLSAIYSNYNNLLNINADTSGGIDRWTTGIRDFTLKGDFTYFKRPGNQLQFGFNTIVHHFIPGETTDSGYNNIPRARAIESAFYFSQKLSVGKRLKLLYGLRASVFTNFSKEKLSVFSFGSGPENVSYFNIEPRLMLQYVLSSPSLLQFSYNRNYQYLQLLQNDELAFSSLETWIPSSSNVRPQYSDLFSVTYKTKSPGSSFSVSTYYKRMGNQLELIDHSQLISNPYIEDELRVGRSNAFGAEVSTIQQLGDFRLSAFYCWSRAFRNIQGINDGKRYAANYDIPHAFKFSLSYELSQSLQVNTYFNYSSGRPATLPIGYFMQQGMRVPIYSGRNLGRMPDYHRLDISLQWTVPILSRNGKQWNNIFAFGLYNIYNRKNPLLYKINPQSSNENLIEEQTFSGITPVFSYSFSF